MRQVGLYGCRYTQQWGLKFGDYVDATALPPIPTGDFGHTSLIGDWGMLMNNTLSCCVVSGAEHETMLWTAESGNPPAVFDDQTTIRNYQTLGGFQPDDPATDQGCDMAAAAQLRVTQGITDVAGNTHKVGAVLELQPGNIEQLWYALYLFDGVGCGLVMSREWESAFAQHSPWDTSNYGNPSGGHYVTLVGRSSGNIQLVTWGQPQLMTPAAYQTPGVVQKVLCYASQEKLRNGVDLEGLSWSDIRADMPKVGAL